MRPIPLAGLIIVATVAVEVAAFVGVVHLVGFGWALALLVAVSLVGGWLVPRQGVRAWRRFRRAAEAGEPPGPQVTDGLVGLIGAGLLAVPGFVTDVLGALLLTPPVRGYARGRLENVVARRAPGGVFGPRRVRVRRTPGGAGPAAGPAADPPVRGTSANGGQPQAPGDDIIDGEIIDP